MSSEDDQNKTEAPTPRRREKAIEDGQVVFSPDFNGSAVLLFVAVAAIWTAPALMRHWQMLAQERILSIDGSHWGIAETVLSARWLFSSVWELSGSVCLMVGGIGLLISQMQTKFTLTSKPIKFELERLSPVKNFERLWSIDSLMKGLQAIVKVVTLGSVALVMMVLWRRTLEAETHGTLGQSIGVGWSLLQQLMLSLAGAAFVWGTADYLFKWFRNEQKLRMSRQELKDEQKDESGDPQVRGRIRKLQMEAAQRKTLQDVPKASVVVTNPTHFAVALRYESGSMKAPKVLAKGSDAFARRIIAVAREHGIPVLERKPLARALYALVDVGKDIPLEFYRAVAEILAHVYRLKNSRY